MPDEVATPPGGDQQKPGVEETRTTIDALLELLRSKGKSELNSVAVMLSIDPRIIEKWAKVLEKGNLIRISYEVGKMYLEPMSYTPEKQQDMKQKTDVTKYILEEDLATEKISLDKFSKSIDSLNVSIDNIEKMYQRKLPDVQKIISELDKAYEPIERKRRSMDHIKSEAEENFKEISRKADNLYTKLGTFSPKQTEIDLNDKLNRFNKILENISDAQNALNEMERNQGKFFKSLEADINTQVREFRKQLGSSRYNVEQVIKSNSRQLNELVKEMRGQVHSAKRLSREIEGFRKDFESAKHDLDVLKNDFVDKYEMLKTGIANDSKLVDAQSKRVEDEIKSIKQNLGDASKFEEDIRKWQKEMSDISREVTATKTDIIKLTNQLNAVDSNRNMSIEAKTKAVESISEDAKKTKERTSRIKKVIKDTTEDMKNKAEGQSGR